MKLVKNATSDKITETVKKNQYSQSGRKNQNGGMVNFMKLSKW